MVMTEAKYAHKCRAEFQTIINGGTEIGVCQLPKGHKGSHDCTVIDLNSPKSAQPQLPPLDDCPRCKGFGQVDKSTSVPRKCYLCQGTGKLPRNSEDLELQLLSALADTQSWRKAAEEVLLAMGRGGQSLGDAVANLRKMCDETRR